MKSQVRKIFSRYVDDNTEPLIVRSPGRVNLIGEHTDYNDGFVLPAAIDKAAYLAVTLRNDTEVHLAAHDLNRTYSINLDDLKPASAASWPNYILGVVAQFKKAGFTLKGFNAVLTGNVPIGAGMSSSAAVECAASFAINELFGTGLNRITLLKMAQLAEHEYAGVNCGIMDQFASMMGKKDQMIKLDCRSLEFDYVPMNMNGLKLVLFNTNVKHSLASSEYNTRRKECEQAVEWVREKKPKVMALRDVTEDMLDKYVLPKDKLIDRRARYVIRENNRLLSACKDLEEGNTESFGKKMFETHDELSRMFGVSCRELDFLVDQVRGNADVLGARMMGGGFGGCTINLVRENAIDRLVESIKPVYESVMNLPLSHYIVSIENGTELL